MANEVATLGLKIDSRDVLKADKALDKLDKTAKKTEKATDAIASTNKRAEVATERLATASAASAKASSALTKANSSLEKSTVSVAKAEFSVITATERLVKTKGNLQTATAALETLNKDQNATKEQLIKATKKVYQEEDRLTRSYVQSEAASQRVVTSLNNKATAEARAATATGVLKVKTEALNFAQMAAKNATTQLASAKDGLAEAARREAASSIAAEKAAKQAAATAKARFASDLKSATAINNRMKLEAVFADNLAKSLDRASNATGKLGAANKKTASAFKLQKGAAQQAGFQVQDFAVQMAGGQSFMVAFGQQASQLAGVLGPGGAVIGAFIAVGAAIGGIFLTSLKKSNDELKEFEGTVKKVESALASVKLDKTTKAVQLQGAAYAKVRAEYDKLIITTQKTKGSEDEFTFLQKLLNSETELLNIRWKTNAAIRAKNKEVETSFEALTKLREKEAELERESKGLTSFDELIAGYKEQSELLKLNSTQQEIFIALKEADVLATSKQGKEITAIITKLFKQKAAIKASEKATKEAAKEKLKSLKKVAKEEKKSITDAIRNTKRLNDSFKLISNADPFSALASGLETFAAKEQKFHDQRMDNEFAIADAKIEGLGREHELIAQNARLNAQQSQDRLGQVSQIATSIAAGFDEGSKAGEAFEKVAKAAGIAQAAVAVASAASAPPPVGFATATAMLALMSSIGLSLGGGGGGGSSASLSESAQASQGTGTVFGDPLAKAGSLGTAFERLEDINLDQQNELRSIFDEMVQLNNNITGLTGVLVRSFGNFTDTQLTAGFNLGSEGAGDTLRDISAHVSENFFEPLGEEFAAIAGGFATDFMSSVIDVFGGSSKTSLVNTGIIIGEQTYGALTEGIEAGTFAVIKTKTKRKFRYKTSFDLVTGELDDNTENQLQLVFENIGDTILGSIDLLGIETASSLADFAISVGQISLHGLSGSEIQEELEAVFSNQANLMSEFLVPELMAFQVVGEETFDTLVRLAIQVSQFNGLVDDLNLNFAATGLEAVELIDSLTTMAGGTEKLNDSLTSYYENFFTAAEQQEDLTNSLTAAMDELGFALPETREGFRSIVEGLDLTTQAGQEAFVTLTQFSESANQVFEAFERGTEFVAGLQRELDVFSLSGSARELFELDEWRDEQLAIANETGMGLAQIEELYGLQRQLILETQLEQQNAALIAANEELLAAMLAEMVSATDDAFGALSRAVDAERSAIDDSFNASVSARKSALSAELDQIKSSATAQVESIKAIEKARTEATKLALSAAKDGLKDITKELGGIVSALDKLRATTTPQKVLRAEALGILQGALSSGNLSGAGEAAGIAANIRAEEFATAAGFAREIGITSGVLSGLEKAGLEQKSVAEQAVEALEATIIQIKESSALEVAASKFNTGMQIAVAQTRADADIAMLTEQHEEDTARLDGILATAQEQLDTLRGIDNSVLSVADAVAALSFAIAGEAAAGPFENVRHAPIQPGGSSIASRSSNPEFIGLNNLGQQNALLSQRELVAEIKALRAEVHELKNINASTAKSTHKSAKQLARWDGDGMPPVRT